MPAGVKWTDQQYREFARAYFEKRIAEAGTNAERRDVLEELSAYVGDWMRMRDRMEHILGEQGLLFEGETERVWPIDPSLTKETT